MEKMFNKTILSTLLGMIATVAGAGDLTVPTGGMQIQTSPAETYEKVIVNGDLAVTGSGVVLKNSGTITIAEDATAPVKVKVENGALWQPTKAETELQIKGKGATVDISSPTEYTKGWSSLGVFGRATKCYLTADAAPTSDLVDIFRLGQNGMLAARVIGNKCPSAVARVLFDGGCVFNANGSSSTSRFQAADGCELRLEGVNGHDVRFEAFANAGDVFGGSGTVVVTGACDVIINAVNDSPAPYANFRGNMQWRQTGDLRLGVRGTYNMYAADQLPYGASTGIVRLEGNNASIPLTLNLSGNHQRLNSLIASNRSILTNASTLTYLQFGDEGADGVMNVPRVDGSKIGIRKVGSGTLAITNTPGGFAYIAVAGGRAEIRQSAASPFRAGIVTNEATFAVYADVSVDSLVATAGSTLVVDGCTLTVSKAAIDPACTVDCRNGGTIVLSYDRAADAVLDGDELTDLWTAKTVLKTGAGTLSLGADNSLAARQIHVAGGTLAFGSLGVTNSFWKFVAKGSANGIRIGVGPVRLYGKDGLPCDGGGNNTAYPSGWKTVDSTTSPADLNAKEIICKPNAPKTPDDSWVPSNAKMWYGGQWVDWRLNGKDETQPVPPTVLLGNGTFAACCFTNLPYVTPANSASWINFIYRTPPSETCVRGYDIRSVWSDAYMVNNWELWTSPDGSDWTMLDAVAGYSLSGQAWYSGGVGGGGSAYSTKPFKLLVMRPDPVGPGVDPTTAFQVDSGATLDCSRVAGGQEVSSLTVDLATGGGTLKGVRLASTGTISLVNSPSSKFVGELPLTFVDSAAAASLDWQVIVNGKTTRSHLVWANGRLQSVGPGLSVIVR